MGTPTKYDVNKDGDISESDIAKANAIDEIELREQKAGSQKRMAWAALLSMTVLTCALFMPFISDTRVTSLASLFGMFYIAQAGIVGAYMGATAWMSATIAKNS